MREKRAALGLLALGVVGWAASLYLLVEHIRARVELNLGGACDINETFNCTVAALSPYAQTPGGFPTAALGVSYYFGFIVLSVVLLRGAMSLAPVLTGLAVLASLYSVALLTLSIVQLHTLCPGCTVTYLVNFACLAVCLTVFRPMPKLSAAPAVIGAAGVFAVIVLAGTYGFGTWAQGRIAAGVRVAESERTTLAVQAAEKNGLSKADIEQLAHRASAPAVGPNEAPVVISVFSDFECPHCAMFAATLRRLHQNYPTNVRIEYRSFPLPGHRWADLAARLGVCVNEEGKFTEFHDHVFEKQDKLSEEALHEIVDDLGLNTAKIVRCAELESTKEVVANDVIAGNRLKIEGTPAFVMNGELTTGFVPYERLEQRIGTLLQSSEHARLAP